ncbi:MAG: hypothetical protein ACRDNS_20885, partial [Trebonia sp.]
MTPTALPDLNCTDLDARLALLAATDEVQGIDYLEVSPDQLRIDVHFVQKATPAGRADLVTLLDALAAMPSNVQITGGERVRGIRLVSVKRVGQTLRLRVNQYGDFSTYTLTLTTPTSLPANGPLLDPPFSSVQFSFKAGCPSRFDCCGACDCDTPAPASAPVDYMAKDFDSFRQALIDRLPAIAPEWLERNEADLGIVLLELLAYAADQLSYLQDAVANEAYLDTARQRISVRRHARLLDYAISEGASARAFVVADVTAECTVPAGTQVLTRIGVPIQATMPPPAAVIVAANDEFLDQARTAALVFETRAAAALATALSEIQIHTWDFGDCCLPAGTTTLDLEGDLAYVAGDPIRQDPWRLRPESFLVVEEIAGVATGLPGDADPTHRQVVALTSVEGVVDPLFPGPLTRVSWDGADALSFPLCLSRSDSEGVLHPIAVAHGNVLVVDHGERREQWWPSQPVPTFGISLGGLVEGSRPLAFTLDEGPSSVWRPLVPGPVATMNEADAAIAIELVTQDPLGNQLAYTAAYDLIGAGQFTQEFVPEVGNDGRLQIRFGDNTNGRAPADGSFIDTVYWVGRGLAGNVGANALAHILLDPGSASLPITRLRNPLPANGGADPETIQQIKVSAPVAFRSPQLRAVTEADYAAAAQLYPGVTQAAARFRWTGSWLTVYLILDLLDRDALTPAFADEVKQFVSSYTQTGYDLDVAPPTYTPLDIELFICVAPDRFRTDVEQAVLKALSSGSLPGGAFGFFSPQNFGFGSPLYLSAMYAAAAAVPGVVSVSATRFSGFYDNDPAPSYPITQIKLAAGVIDSGPLEVLELANDPSLPERGLLT